MGVFIALTTLTFLLPLLGVIVAGKYAGISRRNLALFLAIGAVGWLLAKVPKGFLILPIFVMKGLPLQMEASQVEELLRTDLSLLLVAALAAGLFEEAFKPVGLLLVRPRLSPATAATTGWLVGVGAGLLEAVNFIGAELYRILALKQVTFGQAWHVPVERLLIIFFHGALTSLLVYFVLQRRYFIGLSLPFIIHFAADFVMPYMQLQKLVTSIWLLQGITLAWVALVSFFSFQKISQEFGARGKSRAEAFIQPWPS